MLKFYTVTDCDVFNTSKAEGFAGIGVLLTISALGLGGALFSISISIVKLSY